MLPDLATPHGVYDPVRAEWATPIPSAHLFSPNQARALQLPYDCAIEWARSLISAERNWLVIQPAGTGSTCRMGAMQ